jgi:acylphosphatase
MVINIDKWDAHWSDEIQEKAKKLGIEGVMQALDQHQMRIMICGKDALLDEFIDYLYDFFTDINVHVQELEPFIKERDYRGIFRVI